MKRLRPLLLSVAFSLSLALSFQAASQQANCIIDLPAIDVGHYDVHGDHTAREPDGLTGLTADQRARGERRSFMVFSIPHFTGVLTDVSLIADVYSISPDGAETLRFHSVETPVSQVRDGGFGLHSIYADLAGGTVYGEVGFASGYHFGSQHSLNGDTKTAILAARGQDFAIGGSLALLNSEEIYNEFIVFPLFDASRVKLRLEISRPPAPLIYAEPVVKHLFTNDATVTVRACGAEPLEYHWFIDGTNTGPRTTPTLYVPPRFEPTSSSIFAIVSNAFGAVTSAVVNVRPQPAHVSWPYTNVTLRIGEPFFLSPTISPFNLPTTYMWYRDGLPIGTINPISFYPTRTNDAGSYALVLSNVLGILTSAVFRVDVVATPPVFWTEPGSQTIPLGGWVGFRAHALAGPFPSYQWYRNNTPLTGETNTDLTVFQVNQLGQSFYHVVASNGMGSATSRVAVLTVALDPPQFVVQPQSQVVFPGNVANLSVSLAGNPPPAVQWYLNGQPIPGAVSTFYHIASVSSNHAGLYYCVASNLSGIATSQTATLTVPYVPPVIGGPEDVTLLAGNTAFFILSVSNPPVTVQWQFEGTNIPSNALGDPYYHYLLLNNVDTPNSGRYWAIASNSSGTVTSRVASLVVTTAPPVFVEQPGNLAILEGAPLSIYFNVSGGPAPRFFLLRNGINTGARAEFMAFHFKESTLADAGEYVVVASNRVGVATSQPFQVSVQRVGPLDRWNRRNPIPQGEDLFSIAFGQGKFVAVGRDGTIIHSTDGTNWNIRSVRSTDEIEAVTYGSGRFVAVGESGIVLTSTNADAWEQISLPGVSEFTSITHADGKFVAVGRHITFNPPIVVFISTNGVDWTNIGTNGPQAVTPQGIAYGAGTFVTVDFARAYRSPDATTWTAAQPASTWFSPQSVRFHDGLFIVAGDNGFLATSADGAGWTARDSATLFRMYDTARAGQTFVAVGARGEIRRSTNDGINWTPVPSPTIDRLESITHGNGLFVAVGERGMIVTSPDAQNWTVQLRGSSRDLDDLASGNGLLMTVGKNNTVLTSTDGRTWTRRVLPMTDSNAPPDWHGVAFGAGRWVIVGDSAEIASSTNLIDWDLRAYAQTPTYLKDVIYGGGLWVAVGVGGAIFTSPDAVNWSIQPSPLPFDLNEITYGDGLFVAVGDAPTRNGTIIVSTNGTSWADRTFNTGKNIRAVTHGNGLFVAALNDGQIIYGTNPSGVAWQYATTGVTGDGQNFRGVTYSNGWWMCVGNNGLLLTSTNAALWKTRVTRTQENLHAIRAVGGTFVAVGNEGLILQCDPLITTLAIAQDGTNAQITVSSPWEGFFKIQSSTGAGWQDAGEILNAFGTTDFTTPINSPGLKYFRAVAE